MAIALDATSGDEFGAGNLTESLAHTCAGGADCILTVVVLGNSPLDDSAVTYDGVPLTRRIRTNSANGDASIWDLTNPSAGTHNIVVTKTVEPVAIFGISFTGASGRDATGSNNGNSGAQSSTVNTAKQKGFVVTGCVVQNDNAAVYAGTGTELAADSLFVSNRATYQEYTGGADITENWTSANNPWATAGLEIYEGNTHIVDCSEVVTISSSIRRTLTRRFRESVPVTATISTLKLKFLPIVKEVITITDNISSNLLDIINLFLRETVTITAAVRTAKLLKGLIRGVVRRVGLIAGIEVNTGTIRGRSNRRNIISGKSKDE